MSDNEYRISGQINNRKSRNGIVELSIEAWEKGWRRNNSVGGDMTDESGTFKIWYDKFKIKGLSENRHPELYLKGES